MNSRAPSAVAGSVSHSPAAQPDHSDAVKTEDVPDVKQVADGAEQISEPPADEMDITVPEPEPEPSDTRQRESSPQVQDNEPATSYGTRSRNRNARPNYAEDQDMEFEFAPPKPAPTKNANSSEAKRNQAASVVASTSDPKRVAPDNAFTRFVNYNGVEQDDKSPSVGKDPIAAVTPVPSANPPKKRKAAVSATAAVTAVSAMPTQTAAKRTAPSLSNVSRETNVMTFQTSKAVLKKASLIADDGTALNVEGKTSLQMHKHNGFRNIMPCCLFVGPH